MAILGLIAVVAIAGVFVVYGKMLFDNSMENKRLRKSSGTVYTALGRAQQELANAQFNDKLDPESRKEINRILQRLNDDTEGK